MQKADEQPKADSDKELYEPEEKAEPVPFSESERIVTLHSMARDAYSVGDYRYHELKTSAYEKEKKACESNPTTCSPAQRAAIKEMITHHESQKSLLQDYETAPPTPQ